MAQVECLLALLRQAGGRGSRSPARACASGLLAIVEQQQGWSTGCSTSAAHPWHGGQQRRHAIHTSASAGQGWDRFQRVLGEPVPKAHVLNRTNYKAWCQSGLDLGMAQQLLAEQDAAALLRGGKQADGALQALVTAASTLREVELATQQLADHVTPAMALAAWRHALELHASALAQASSPQQVHPVHPSQLRAQLLQTVEPLARRLLEPAPGDSGPPLSALSTQQLATAMYCLTRSRLEVPELERAVAQELTAANAHRLSGASPATLAALLQAGALRGWGHHEPRAWEALTQALDAHTRAVEADVRDLPLVSKVIQALSARAAHTSSPLWPRATAALRRHLAAWARQAPDVTCDVLYHVVKSGTPDGPSAQEVAALLFPPAESNGGAAGARRGRAAAAAAAPAAALDVMALSPRSLARLAHALQNLPVAGEEDAGRGAGGAGAPVQDETVRRALAAVWSAAAATAVRCSLSDLVLLMDTLSRQQQPPDGGAAGAPAGQHQGHQLARVARDLVALRGLAAPSTVHPTLRLVGSLEAVLGPQAGLLRMLTPRAVKALPHLSPDDIIGLMAAWARSAPLPACAALFGPAATQLLHATAPASSDDGSAGGPPPSQVAKVLFSALRSVCWALTSEEASRPSAPVPASAGGAGGKQAQGAARAEVEQARAALREQALLLADALVEGPSAVWAALGDEARPRGGADVARMLALPEVGLAGHEVVAALRS